MNHWDKRFILLAKHISQWSKDESTKVGAVVVRSDKTIASLGFNGFPKNTADNLEYYLDREVKYERIIHAEMNAILHSRESMKGYTLYTWPFLPCANCAKHIIQVGIARIVAPYNIPERWAKSCETSRTIFLEAGIDVMENPNFLEMT